MTISEISPTPKIKTRNKGEGFLLSGDLVIQFMRYPPILPLINHVWVQCNICVIYGLRHICRIKKQSTDSDLKTDPLTNLIPRQMIVYLSLCGKVAACYHQLLQVTKIRGGYGGGVGWGSVLCWIWRSF